MPAGGKAQAGDLRNLLAKQRRVAALRQVNNHGVTAALADVVFVEARTQPRGFAPNGRVLLRVKPCPSSENLYSDQRFLEVGVPALETPLNHEPQEAGQALVPGEPGACQHPLKLLPHEFGLILAG